ncbi:hypothetical protein [Lutibacter maritimus]|uniref:Phage tail tube protein n=1 Tax=Lutibacter maritimus TaxID=593133 RepID=A0A1I6NS12_9FLAO|nr:hypothetical protein [Lutibacter maritimus]SFS30796.1 hypothetical protein SAMN04488006_0487 [Lutibacter maritimus]
MGKTQNLLGVGKFEMGVPGDGIMGAALTEFSEVEVNSMVFDGPQANTETIPTEQEDSYITLNSNATPAKLVVRLYGVDKADFPMLMGGTYTAGTKTWDAPEVVPDIWLSVRLTGKEISGVKQVLEIPYGKINAREQGNITKNGLPAIDVEIIANTPVAANGTRYAPYNRKEITV